MFKAIFKGKQFIYFVFKLFKSRTGLVVTHTGHTPRISLIMISSFSCHSDVLSSNSGGQNCA